jgi:hypothetical protein
MTGGGLGRVHTERVVLFDRDDPLVLESGATIAPAEVAFETYGTLDEARSNAESRSGCRTARCAGPSSKARSGPRIRGLRRSPNFPRPG